MQTRMGARRPSEHIPEAVKVIGCWRICCYLLFPIEHLFSGGLTVNTNVARSVTHMFGYRIHCGIIVTVARFLVFLTSAFDRLANGLRVLILPVQSD